MGRAWAAPVCALVLAAAGCSKPVRPLTDTGEIAGYLEAYPGPVTLRLALELSSENWRTVLDALGAGGKDVFLELSACTPSASTAAGGLALDGTFDPYPLDDDTRRNEGKGRILSLVLPAGAVSLAAGSDESSGAFYGFKRLLSVSGEAVTTIGGYAFYKHGILDSVDFPAAEAIGSSAFSGCKRLRALDLPRAQSIGSYAFAQCGSLGSLDLNEDTRTNNWGNWFRGNNSGITLVFETYAP